MTYFLFLALTILTILSQLTHTWFVFNSFSRLSGRLKIAQSVIFCSILSIAIYAFVVAGKPGLACLGAVIEAIINVYYYGIDFFENGIRAKVRRAQSIATFWRKNWIAIFFGLLIPVLIYIFSEQLNSLK